jgi:molecular chaperone GrpE
MTGVNDPGHEAEGWESETGAVSDSPSGAGIDDIFEGEIVDVPDDGRATEILDGESPDINEVKVALAQRDEYLDSLRRLQAEFENYRKRVAKQQSDQVARAALSLVDKLLPVLDTLDLAITHLGDAGSTDGRALLATSSQLHDVLTKEGLERIDPTGEAFDPNAHEAVGHLAADDAGGADAGDADGAAMSGDPGPGAGEPIVAQVMRPGYRWRGAVVRPAMVMVRG